MSEMGTAATDPDTPLNRPCEDCGAEVGEPCRIYCTGRPDDTDDEEQS